MASIYLSVASSMTFGGFLSDFIVNRKILSKNVSRRVFISIGQFKINYLILIFEF